MKKSYIDYFFVYNSIFFLLITHKGHHEHAGDAAHSKLQDKWTSRLKHDKTIGDINDV